jgi:penicillin-insensitive murein endopeptidase
MLDGCFYRERVFSWNKWILKIHKTYFGFILVGSKEIFSMRFIYLLLFFSFYSCQSQTDQQLKIDPAATIDADSTKNKIEEYLSTVINDSLPSISSGTVGAGSLEHGKLVPFSGVNFTYFDTLSYTSGRAFVNDKLLATLHETYAELAEKMPKEHFCIMECSNEHGGRIHPHRTHQNGLSVDFMTPLKKDGASYYDLDRIGATHYLLEFDNDGKYTKEASISIDFEKMALHLVTLERVARMNGLKISKVIFKTELKDNLFASSYGKQLKESGIYFTKSLTPMINSLHDDHYHIDFDMK